MYKINWKYKHFAFAEKPKEPGSYLLEEWPRTEIKSRR